LSSISARFSRWHIFVKQWITLDRDYARFPGLTWRVPGG
jgi:hypothetical protein